MYPHGLVGNCRISALIRLEGSIEWLCLPSPDSEPALGRLLDPGGGHCSVKLSGSSDRSSQHYIENTNVLVTEVEDNCSQKIRITDFCPRHEKRGPDLQAPCPAEGNRAALRPSGSPCPCQAGLRVEQSPDNSAECQDLARELSTRRHTLQDRSKDLAHDRLGRGPPRGME